MVSSDVQLSAPHHVDFDMVGVPVEIQFSPRVE